MRSAPTKHCSKASTLSCAASWLHWTGWAAKPWQSSVTKNSVRSEKRGKHGGFATDRHRRALPSRTVTNEDLSRTVDTSDEWIVSRTGIRTRHWCAPEESASTLAISAAKQALERSGCPLPISAAASAATLSAPDAAPSVACRVQAALALRENIPTLDVNAACSGFVYAAAAARGLLITLGGQYAWWSAAKL